MKLFRFQDLVGNTTTVSLLQRSLVNKTIKNFVILSGAYGTGKSTCAEISGLYLTCEHPVGNEPCRECTSCTTNIRALKGSGRSNNLVKYNVGAVKDKKDVLDMIREIFNLQGKGVYILEEFHALKPNEQIPFMDEIDRLSEDTYVFFTTTKEHAILPELRSRALSLRFNRLKQNESLLLFDRVVTKMGFERVNAEAKRLILKYAAGVPRNITKLIDFVGKNHMTDDEVRDFLGFISNDVFIELFNSMKDSMHAMARTADDMLLEYTLEVIIPQFREFMVNVVLLVKGGVSEGFTKTETKAIKEVLSDDTIYKLANVVRDMNPMMYTEADFKLALIRMHQILNGNKSNVLTSNSANAVTQSHKAERLFKETSRLRQENKFNEVEELDLSKLKELTAFSKGE